MRKLKIYKQSSTNYRSVPTIILKGQWLSRYGFDSDSKIEVECEYGKLTIRLQEPENTSEKA